MFDLKHFIFIPSWVKILAVISLIATILALSFVIYAAYQNNMKPEWGTAALSGLNLSVTGLLVLVIVFFAERQSSPERVSAGIQHFLTHLVPSAFKKLDPSYVEHIQTDGSQTKFEKLSSQSRVMIQYCSPNIGASYWVTAFERTIQVYVQLNVRELVAVYKVACPTSDDESRIRDIVKPIFRTQTDSRGMRCFNRVMKDDSDQLEYLKFYMIKNLGENFNVNNAEKIYWANEVMLACRSIITYCKRNGVAISYEELGYDKPEHKGRSVVME